MHTGSSAFSRAWYVSSFVIAAFLLLITAVSAQAQTAAPPLTAPPSSPSAAIPGGNVVSAAISGEAAVLPEVQRDETITHEDFGTVAARVLPDSPLHIFKRFGWGLQEAFTFDPVRDAELKLKHANQQLSEVKQLVDEKGLIDVRPAIIESAIEQAKDKIQDVQGTADGLKAAKESQPEVVDRLLNEVTDKQIKQQRVLDVIAKEAVAVKVAAEQGAVEISATTARELDRVVAKAEETRDASVAAMTDMLVAVEDSPQSVGVRITNVLDRQGGSEFKELKHLEVLAAVKENVPEEAKNSIEVAENGTMRKFEAKVKELPPVVRAEKFKLYIKDVAADDTRLLTLLDQIKQSPGVPTDILSKIEEAKELAVKKFERKLRVIEDPRVESQLLEKMESDDVDNLVVLEEMKSRMSKDSEEFKRIEETHAKSEEQFKKSFSGADEEEKAKRFQGISRSMLSGSSPKKMKLIVMLEAEVGDDVDRQAFVERLQKDMKRQFEDQFRREGDKFMERVATLDPNDLAVFQQFDFDKQFVDDLAKRNTSKFKDYMKTVDSPDEFDIFHERFFEVPKTVIETIRANDADFQNTLQFKVRTMETVRLEKKRELASSQLDLREREVVHQGDREARKADDKFFEELENTSFDDFDKRKSLWENKINDSYTRTEQQYNDRRKIFEDRAKLDPWCDEQCQQIQLQFMEQSLRHEKERLSDDLSRQQRRIEIEQVKTKTVPGQEGAFAATCDSVESCDAFCKANPAVMLCKGFITGPVVQICRYPSYWDSGAKSCVTPKNMETTVISTVVQSCPSGQYYDYARQGCVVDPYYRSTTSSQTCPYGGRWNEKGAFCELDTRAIYTPPTPVPGEPGRPIGTVAYPDYYPADNAYCGTNFRWDGGRRECVSRDFQACPSGQYYDYYEKRCKQEWKDCGAGSYWDAGKEQCVKNTYQPVPGGECPVGFRKDNAGVCVSEWSDVVPLPVIDCQFGYDWNPATKKCESSRPITYCTQEYKPVCGVDGATYSNECFAKQAGVAVKLQGACQKTTEPKPVICPANKYNFQGTYSCDTSVCSGGCGYDASGCPNSCVGGLNPTCPVGQQWDYYTKACKAVSGSCKSSCETPCGSNSYCLYDNTGCATGCAPTCTSPAWYDMELKKCVTMKEQNEAHGCKSGQYWDSYFKACRDQYCPSGWKWDDASYSCVSATDPTCKSSCGDACTGGSWCMFDQKGCATGCSPTCPENQYYDQYQKKCVGYYKPATCPANDYTNVSTNVSGSGTATASSCNYTKCPSGCNYDNSGCPSACYTPPPSSCTDNGYNVKGTASCDYSKCKNGCSWDSKGCPTGCYTPPTCPDTGYGSSYTSGDGSKYTSCNYTKCPNGCNFDGGGCPNGCYGSGTCGDKVCQNTETAVSCPTDCGSGSSSCGGAAGLQCPSGYTCVYPSGPAYSDMMGTCTISTTACNYNKICDSGESSGSCWSDCGGGGTACDYDKICDSGETVTSCPNDCGSTYPGDANSCPGFSYSRWDSKGTRYCQLNSMIKCEYSYPAYLTESNYTATECPTDTTGTTCPMTAANDYSNGSKVCSTRNCPAGCVLDSNGCPASCTTTSAGYCGDGKCNNTETSAYCPADCGTGGYCGDKICVSPETVTSCPSDCGSTTCPASKGNNYVSGGSSCSYTACPSGCNFDPGNSCPLDCYDPNYKCPASTYMQTTSPWTCNWSTCTGGCNTDSKGCATGCKTSTASCGDKVCNGSETTISCPTDCGTTGTSCPSTIANNYIAGSKTCYSATCTQGCNYDGSGCPSTCWSSTTTVGYCGDKICNNGETATSCPGDCGSTPPGTTCPATSYNMGVGTYACNYTTCPSGCMYDGSGCPNGCMTSSGTCTPNSFNGNTSAQWACSSTPCPNGCEFTTSGCATSCKTVVTCPSNGYTSGTGTYMCNYTTCPNGCTYDGSGCATACQPSLCTDNTFNQPGTMTCNMSTCPSGCTWGSNGCPSGCYTSTPPPAAGFFRRLGSILYALITLPARAFGL